MDGSNIVLIILGIYLLVSSYFIVLKDMHFMLLLGDTYRNVRLLSYRKDLNKRLGKVSFIFGFTLLLVNLVYIITHLINLYIIINLGFIYFIINMFLISRDINNGKYN